VKILVLNSGSSSLKYQLIDMNDNKVLIRGHVDGIGLDTCFYKYTINFKGYKQHTKIKNHTEAVKLILNTLNNIIDTKKIDAIGHRVVHGGEYYSEAVKINKRVMHVINGLSELAPLHNPPNLAGIKACKKFFPKIPQVAVFDTAFHQTIPKKAYLYGIPLEYYEKYGIRKYGFHGTSHKYVMLEAKKILKKKSINLITCHLGNGSSITAIEKDKSIDTSMGFTPLQGLMMGTRSGDIDPAIITFLCKKLKKRPDEITSILNKESGLLGIDGYSDIRVIHEKAIKGNKKCILGLDMFAYRVTEYIGSYLGIMKKVDAIVFTAGISEGAYFLRELICKRLENVGIKLDKRKNKSHSKIISAKNSKIKVLVIPTNEELMIARETEKIIN
jgi:acetate kinase